MKCFSRYLPYIFRPPNTILSSSCHTEAPVNFVNIGGSSDKQPALKKPLVSYAISLQRREGKLTSTLNKPFIVASVYGGQKKASDSLELELQTVEVFNFFLDPGMV
ncbi:serine/threonine-protein phosphatase 2A regulatory subunit B beta isoform [Cricetulus griseus]|nr:serine/threonine-protein phosphatase 2A regulatory subunit B beta isoform [Cricetulus griseus]